MNINFLARSKRKSKGWTQHNLSKRCGISVSVIGKFEMGEVVDPAFRETILRNLGMKKYILKDE
jgi:transcriptional regulator with XRE-family HTH domain